MGTYINVASGTQSGEVWTFTVHTFNAAGTVAGAAAA